MLVIAVGILWSAAGFRQFLSHWSRRKRLRSLWVLVRAAGQELAKVGGASARVLPPSAALFAPRHLHASIRTSLSLHMGRIGSALAFRLWVDICSTYVSLLMCAFGRDAEGLGAGKGCLMPCHRACLHASDCCRHPLVRSRFSSILESLVT